MDIKKLFLKFLICSHEMSHRITYSGTKKRSKRGRSLTFPNPGGSVTRPYHSKVSQMMSNGSSLPRRKSIRLKEYDYSFPGTYFITICTENPKCLFGKIINGRMVLNRWGQIIQNSWEGLARVHANVILDVFIIMPNHIHGILILNDEPVKSVGSGLSSAQGKQHGISEIVRGFKTITARRINQKRGTIGRKFWQRNYFDRVVRNEKELDRIRKYILDNPVQWELDHDNPETKSVSVIQNFWDES